VRIAVVSDIHGSLRALEAVVRDLHEHSPDIVMQGGDLAVNGPRPAEVIDRVRELGWPGVVGNTDELLWNPDARVEQERRAPALHNLLTVLFEHTGPATGQMIGPDRLAWLQTLPEEQRVDDHLLIHASPGDLWRAPMPDVDDATLAGVFGGLGAATVVHGHIHRPYVRRIGELTVVNSGSVGLPWDGDPRAAYVLIENGKASVQRVEYDVEGEIGDLARSGYPFADWLAAMRREGKPLPPPTP
jgi:predicted phosphodiesterase